MKSRAWAWLLSPWTHAITIVAGVSIGCFFFFDAGSQPDIPLLSVSAPVSADDRVQVQPVADEPVKPIIPVGIPLHISIPSIHVDAPIHGVGLKQNGEMEAPKSVSGVAWYSLGSRPGSGGISVLAGHLDGPNSVKGVFWDLHKVQIGDIVQLKDEAGVERTYKVTKTAVYDVNSAPLQDIFETRGVRDGVNLITCNGDWDHSAKNYTKRLIVYTEAITN